jgi:hypothetical protein
VWNLGRENKSRSIEVKGESTLKLSCVIDSENSIILRGLSRGVTPIVVLAAVLPCHGPPTITDPSGFTTTIGTDMKTTKTAEKLAIV